jgi:predicted Zn-dependent protease with MMP-like domain
MAPDRFEELVGDALDLIPPALAQAIDNVVILVEAKHPEDPELLGLYCGTPLTERDTAYAGALPDTITIYREPLLEICDTEADVVEEVAITVIHEVAHHFGIEEDRLHELGWG